MVFLQKAPIVFCRGKPAFCHVTSLLLLREYTLATILADSFLQLLFFVLRNKGLRRSMEWIKKSELV